jgi:hypothetical protein
MNLTRSKRRNRSLAPILSALATTILLGESLSDAAACIEEQTGKPAICSAKDVRITFADNVKTIFGEPLTECVHGQSITFIADFHVQTSTPARYDIGLYFAIDGDPNGDGAMSGACSANIIKDRHTDPAYPNTVTLGAAVAANLDGDACRDIDATNGWRNIAGKVVTLRIDNALCRDNDADGHLNLPNCISWANNPAAVCNSPENTAPHSAVNCGCDISFNLPIRVVPEVNQIAEVTTTTQKTNPVQLSESIAAQPSEP